MPVPDEPQRQRQDEGEDEGGLLAYELRLRHEIEWADGLREETHVPRNAAPADRRRTLVPPAYVMNALVLRTLPGAMSFTAGIVALLCYPGNYSDTSTPAGRCLERVLASTLHILQINVLFDSVTLLAVIRSIAVISVAMRRDDTRSVQRVRKRFYRMPYILVVYGVLWAPVCIVACGFVSTGSVSDGGDPPYICDSSEQMRATGWAFVTIVMLTVSALMVIGWALQWFWLYARHHYHRKAALSPPSSPVTITSDTAQNEEQGARSDDTRAADHRIDVHTNAGEAQGSRVGAGDEGGVV